MLGGSTAGKSLEQLQKAVMGMDPTIQPFQALAAIQKMVKGKEMQAAMQAQQPAPQGSVAQRKMMEVAAMRNPYMAGGLGAAPVAPPVTTPMGEEAPVGMAGGGMVAFKAGGLNEGYKYDFEAPSMEDQLSAIQKYKEALGAKNAEFLDPIKKNIASYEEEAAKKDKYAFNDALIAAGLGMMGGKSQYAMQNIGEGGLKGLAAYQDAQKLGQTAREKSLAAQAEMAKSRIALEKGDETAAVQMANQSRQDRKDAATLALQAQHYANADRAAMAAANARGLGLGALSPYQYGQLRDKASDNVKANKNFPMQLMQARAAAKKAGQEFDEQKFTEGLVDQEFQKMLRGMSGGATIAQSSPGNQGAGGKDKVIDFSSI
jgi:hypothetical protein